MNLKEFISEAIRSSDIKPRPVTDLKTKEGQAQQAIRSAGDVGKKELLQKVTGKKINNARQFRKAGRKLATDAGAAQFGDQQDPVDRALDITRAPARYQKQVEKQRGDFNKGKKPKDRVDDTPGVEPDEYDKLPQAERQRRAVEAGREVGRFSAQGEVEDALDAARVKSTEPEAREPIKITTSDGDEIEVADSPFLRHGYQRSGIDVGDKEEDPDYIEDDDRNPRQLRDADIDTIVSGMMDPERSKISDEGSIDPDSVTGKKGKEVAHSQTPTKRDLEQIYRYQQSFTDALEKEDSKAIQDMSFKYDIDDETLNKFISRFSVSARGNDELVQKLKMAGLAPGRMGATYGGDLGPEAADFRVEGAPDGVYDFDKMKKNNKELFNKALVNRGREAARTYLKQGGVDAYAQHEGMRSIGDMDLEHIRALKSQQEDGNGFDHPDNWVWASSQLNRLRGNTPLTKAAKKFDVGNEVKSYDKQEVLKSYENHIQNVLGDRPSDRDGQKLWDELKATIDKDIGGKPSSRGGTGPFSAAATLKRTPEEREAEIKRLTDAGIPKKAAEGIIAKVETKNDLESKVNTPGLLGQENRIGGKPLAAGEDEYEQDTKTEFRDETMFQKALDKLKKTKKFKGKNNDVILASDEGQDLLTKIYNLNPAKAGAQTEVEDVIEDDEDDI